MKVALFWDVAPRSLVETGGRFRCTIYCLHHQATSYRIVGSLRPNWPHKIPDNPTVIISLWSHLTTNGFISPSLHIFFKLVAMKTREITAVPKQCRYKALLLEYGKYAAYFASRIIFITIIFRFIGWSDERGWAGGGDITRIGKLKIHTKF
jgi:hypothetical protein